MSFVLILKKKLIVEREKIKTNNTYTGEYEAEFEIMALMEDGCTRSEAIKHLKNGASVLYVDEYLGYIGELLDHDVIDDEGYEEMYYFISDPLHSNLEAMGQATINGLLYIIEYAL